MYSTVKLKHKFVVVSCVNVYRFFIIDSEKMANVIRLRLV